MIPNSKRLRVGLANSAAVGTVAAYWFLVHVLVYYILRVWLIGEATTLSCLCRYTALGSPSPTREVPERMSHIAVCRFMKATPLDSSLSMLTGEAKVEPKQTARTPT